jgi:hypothetical protein
MVTDVAFRLQSCTWKKQGKLGMRQCWLRWIC